MPFPTSPSDGQRYSNGRTTWEYSQADDAWKIVTSRPVTGTSFPADPVDGDFFWHETQETLYMWSDAASAWIDVSTAGGSVVYTCGSFPPSAVDGQLCWRSDHDVMYIWLDAADAWIDVNSAVSSSLLTYKNAIINGDMRVAQRGTSFAAISSGYTLDRWEYSKNGAMVHTVSRDSSTPTSQFGYSMKFDVTTADASIAADDYAFIRQKVEGYDFQRFVGQTASLSFWVKAGKTGTFCVSFRNSARDRSYVVEVDIEAANTWEYKEISIDFDYSGGTWNYTNGVGIEITFCLVGGSTFQTTADAWQNGNYFSTSNQDNFVDNTDVTCDFWITGVQLELGGLATAFEFLSFQEQLAHCQRYFYKTYQYSDVPATNTFVGMAGVQASSSGFAMITHVYPVCMRTNSTVTLYGKDGTAARMSTGAGVNYTASQVNSGDRQCVVQNSSVAPGGSPMYSHIIADAEL